MYPILHDQYVTDFVETRRQVAARFGTRESNTVRFIAWASCRLSGHSTKAAPARTREFGSSENTALPLPR